MFQARFSRATLVATVFLSLFCGSLPAHAQSTQFTSSFLYNAASWPGSDTDVGVYGQGFTPDLDVIPDRGYTDTDLVGLDRFTFFKDGYTDSASDVKLAIVNNFWLDLSALTTSSTELMGLSTNTLASTAGLSVGDPYTFEFPSLQLEYGSDYGAIFVNDDGLGNLSPVKVSALTVDYAETSEGSGVWAPVANYGTDTDYQYSVSNYIDSGAFGDYLTGFSDGGDAKFEAVFNIDDPRDTDFEFSNSMLNDANTWAGTEEDPGVYGQGFRPSLDPSLTGHLATDQVGLDKFSFFKDGYTDGQTDIKLVIIEDMFMDLTSLTTSSAGVVGVSTNTIASTAGLAEGDEYTFDFDNLQLNYIDDYAAIFVNDDGLGNLTPIKVSALTADYVETSEGSGVYVPVSNYGEEGDAQFATSIELDTSSGAYLVTFDQGGDAKFEAVYDVAGIDGDLDGDGDVDVADLMIWQREDGSAAGLALWQDNFGTGSSSAPAVTAVPEPAAAFLAWLAACGLITARRRDRARQ